MRRDHRSVGAARPPRLPWVLSDLSRLAVFQVLSLVALIFCYAGADQSGVYDHELYWVVGGSAAVMVSGLSWMAWLLVGARSLRARQRRLDELTARLFTAEKETTTPHAPSELVSLPEMTRYHRPDCPLIRNKQAMPAAMAEHVRAGRTPCGVCAP